MNENQRAALRWAEGNEKRIAALAMQERESLAAAYVQAVGYNPFFDDPYVTLECVAATLDAVTAEIQDN